MNKLKLYQSTKPLEHRPQHAMGQCGNRLNLLYMGIFNLI